MFEAFVQREFYFFTLSNMYFYIVCYCTYMPLPDFLKKIQLLRTDEIIFF